MKKSLSIMLALLMLLSLGTASFAEEARVFDTDAGGIRVSLPGELANTKGIFEVYGSGEFEFGSGLYYTLFQYIGETEEEMLELEKKFDDESITEEELILLLEEDSQNYIYPMEVIAAQSEGQAEAYYEEILSYDMHPSRTKLGEADGYLFFLYDYTDDYEEQINTLRPEFAEECRNVISALREALLKAELFAPVKPADPYAGVQLSFETADLDGNAVKSEELFAQNKITMLNIWATWCGPCKGELRELGEIDRRLQEYGCGIVGMLLDGEEPDALEEGKALLAENNADYLNLIAPEGLDEELMIMYIPTSFLVDRDGVILASIVGAQVEIYEPMIQSLLDGEAAAPTETPADEPAANSDGYRVLVCDADGNPVEGVKVQFCSEDTCFLGTTDAEGAAVFDMPGGQTYTVHILKVPAGYEKNSEEYVTQDYPSDLAVTINKAA